ncbi:hypothetical protein TrRE_jg4120 [Triparma retinervis]|uniref:Man1/Src1 C-terminal domain-containing protein n=1 Tax=Triparma retinervis TaxID=2557542 RepID=A0A9W7DPP1_9STRA|nr:hypothetical protein TrRE_jg4120 [Triparma retinervis]
MPRKTLKSAATAVVAATKAEKLAKSKAAAKEWATKRAADKKANKNKPTAAKVPAAKEKKEEEEEVTPPPKKKPKASTTKKTSSSPKPTPKPAEGRSTRGRKRVVEESSPKALPSVDVVDKKRRKSSAYPSKSKGGRAAKAEDAPLAALTDGEEKGPNGTPVKDRTPSKSSFDAARAGKVALSHLARLVAVAFAVVIMGGGLNYVGVEYIKPLLQGGSDEGRGGEKVCFNDKFMSKRMEDLAERYGAQSECRIEDTVEICPSEATCYLGKVRDCDHLGHGRHLKLSPDGGACVLDEEGEDKEVNLLLSALQSTTLEHTCHCWGLSRFTDTCTIPVMERVDANNGHPLFLAGTIAKKAGIGAKDVEFLSHAHPGIQVGPGQEQTVGLTAEYAKSNVQFPFTCYLQVLASDLAWYCLKGTWALAAAVAMVGWRAFLMYPVGVGGATAAAAVVASGRRRSRITQERLTAVLAMKGVVHKILQESQVGLSKDMIRDDVLNTMEPRSAKRRRGLMGTWGTVLKQLKTDSRIRVAEGVNRATGELDLLFTWVYTPRKKGRKEEEEEGEEGKGGRRRVVLG